MSSSSIPSTPPSPDEPLFEHSIGYRSALPSIIKGCQVKALSMVPKAAKNEEWIAGGSYFIARKIIAIVYEEFQKIVREQFKHPQYQLILESSIKNKFGYFYGDLLDLVEKALRENGVEP